MTSNYRKTIVAIFPGKEKKNNKREKLVNKPAKHVTMLYKCIALTEGKSPTQPRKIWPTVLVMPMIDTRREARESSTPMSVALWGRKT